MPQVFKTSSTTPSSGTSRRPPSKASSPKMRLPWRAMRQGAAPHAARAAGEVPSALALATAEHLGHPELAQRIEDLAARVARNGFQVVDLKAKPPMAGDALFYRNERLKDIAPTAQPQQMTSFESQLAPSECEASTMLQAFPKSSLQTLQSRVDSETPMQCESVPEFDPPGVNHCGGNSRADCWVEDSDISWTTKPYQYYQRRKRKRQHRRDPVLSQHQGHDVPSPGTSSQLRDWDSRTSHARRNCSVEFQHLLDRLLHQHILEVSEGGSSSGGGLHTRTTRTTERSSMESIRGSHRSSLNMMDNMKTLTENVRRRKMEDRRLVHASRILAEWDHGTEANEASFTSSIVKEQKTTAKSEMTVHFEDRVAVSETIKFDLLITALVGLNVLWMAIQLQVHGFKVACDIGMYCEHKNVPMQEKPSLIPTKEDFESRMASYFLIGDAIFAFIFAADVTFRLCALRSKFWRRWINWLDLAVSITCLIEILVVIFTTTGSNLVILRILRFARLARAVRVVAMSAHLASFQLLIKCLIACKGMLLWSFILLAFVQCVAGLAPGRSVYGSVCIFGVVSSLCWDFIQDPFQSEEHRQEVFLYYGSFSRTTLTLFEILFANWAPACRVLVENVSEWFSIFFLAYRCVLGFAILNVVNAVFVQQTMKTASSDEELAFRQKERDIVSYNRKVRRLFQSIDSSGDGSITLEEFEKLVTSPKLRFWMSQLELEYHDLLSLFEFLDNGDGVITLTEFIEGAARLRGQAKALDVWRMETKVEILFEEVLFALKMNGFAMSNVDHNMSGASNNSEVRERRNP
eukprot:g5184.t1